MKTRKLKTNTIIQGHTLYILKMLPDESVDCIITSPPYYGLRDYGSETEAIWNGDVDCEHEWGGIIGIHSQTGTARKTTKEVFSDFKSGSNFCKKCNAWKGQLGLEPTLDLYLDHMLQITAELRRVLKKTGTMFWNHGDSYYGGGHGGWKKFDDGDAHFKDPKYGKGRNTVPVVDWDFSKYPAKSLQMQNYRLAERMIDEQGWILRNQIIWYKRNCMPSSAKDRFTVDFEPVFFFTKNNKVQYWVNEKTGGITKKKPLGLKGLEGIDWDWKVVGQYYSECDTKISGGDSEMFGSPRARKHRDSFNIRVKEAGKGRFLQGATDEEIKNYGKGKRKKVTNWGGRDYWFEMQYEPHKEVSISRESRGVNINKWNKENKYGGNQSMQGLSKPRLHKKYKNTSYGGAGSSFVGHSGNLKANGTSLLHPLGRSKRCVWDIPTTSFSEAHFAVFPIALIVPMIQSGCPEFICEKCGLPREKIYETITKLEPGRKVLGIGYKTIQASEKSTIHHITYKEREFYTNCQCGTPFKPGIVLDPFIGSGTVAITALRLKRNFIGIELNPDYIKMAKKRIREVYLEALTK